MLDWLRASPMWVSIFLYNSLLLTITQKFDWRKQGVDKLLADTSCSAVDKKKWQRVRNVLLELQTQGQSSEDTDNEDGGLVITQPYYRRRLITEMLEDLDQNIKELERRQKAASGKRNLPRPSHPRRRTKVKSKRTVFHGLPRSCYHRRAISDLAPHVIDSLEINKKEIQNFDQWALAEDPNSDTDTSMSEGDWL